jgi:hypothetical protein
MVAQEVLDKKAARAVAQAAMLLVAHEMSHEHLDDEVYLGAVYRYVKLWDEGSGTAEERFKHADKHIFKFKPCIQRQVMMLEAKDELRKSAIPEAQGYIKEGLKNPYQS